MQNQFTRTYRIWHWLMAFSVIGLLGTVLLRKTFLSWHTNSNIIISKLSEHSIEISADISKEIAKAIRAGMWEWHYIFGLILGISILIRIYMMLSKQAQHPIVKLLQAPSEKKIQYTVYLFLCFFVVMISLSGGFLYFYKDLGFTKDAIHWVKEAHELMMWGIIIFASLHLAGVLKHELDTKESIVSKMIHGD